LETKNKILSEYLPEASVAEVLSLLDKYPCHLKIVNKRRTKHGDFKRYADGKIQITINNDLNPYRFLLTLIHEFAHLITFEEFKRVKPHGQEWKRNFKLLMLPFLNPDVFPEDILAQLARYLINPKASSDTDVNLSLRMRAYDAKSNKTPIFEIPSQSKFHYNNRIYI
jgi:SprT protein